MPHLRDNAMERRSCGPQLNGGRFIAGTQCSIEQPLVRNLLDEVVEVVEIRRTLRLQLLDHLKRLLEAAIDRLLQRFSSFWAEFIATKQARFEVVLGVIV